MTRATSYTSREQVESALAALPPTSVPSFLQEIRQVIERTRNPEVVFRRICETNRNPRNCDLRRCTRCCFGCGGRSV